MNEERRADSMSGTGYLIVRVTTASGAIPVEGATVIVRDYNFKTQDRGGILAVLNSQSDGNTPKIALATQSKSNSTAPGNQFPFATDNIDVVADGYYRQYFNNVPIYDSITSIQPATLIPRAQTPTADNIDDGGQYFEQNVNPALRTDSNNFS